jgi:hypothetical protein
MKTQRGANLKSPVFFHRLPCQPLWTVLKGTYSIKWIIPLSTKEVKMIKKIRAKPKPIG